MTAMPLAPAESLAARRAGRAYMPAGARTDWATPPDIFDRAAALALALCGQPFNLDPCGAHEHHYSAYRIVSAGGRCFDGSTPALDGLLQPWGDVAAAPAVAFVNPPYGRAIAAWIAKIAGEVEAGRAALVCALIPVRTDTRWWQRFIVRDVTYDRLGGHPLLDELQFLDRRVRFVGAPCARCARARPQCRQAHAGAGNVCVVCGCTSYQPTGAPFPNALAVWRAA